MQPTRELESLDHDQLVLTVRNLLAEANALSSRISALNEIGLAVNQSLDLARIERIIAKQAKWLLDFEHCSVCLKENDIWSIKTLFGAQEPERLDLQSMQNLVSVMKTPRPVIIRTGSDSTFLSDYQSQLIIPLTADNVFLGTINFAATEPDHYTYDDMRIGYMLSLQLSSAIRNADVVKELKATRHELNLRVEELDAYGHTIAHDLKSPLSNILLRTQLFAMRFSDEVPDKALEMVKSIELSGNLMHRMIDQLLMLAKLHNVDEKLVLVDAADAVKSALERFNHQMEEKQIIITTHDLPDAYGQNQWVEEVFANLISNAIKYMGEDNRNPSISIRGEVQGEFTSYSVIDTGIGIKPEKQADLFEMFSRVHDIDGIEGLGLGLSIVHRIVKKLGGDIGVESVYGEGTTFWFTLPTKNPHVKEESE